MAANEIARVYASSLVDVGKDKNILPQLEEEIGFLASLLASDADLRDFLFSPSFSKESKIEFVKKVFGGKLSEYVVSFLCVLVENNRQSFIDEINEAMIDLVNEVNNRQKVQITTSMGLDAAMKEKITQKLKDKYKKEIIVEEKVDAGILGGIIIRIGDTVIDGSLSKDLKNIRNNLLNSKVRSEMAYED